MIGVGISLFFLSFFACFLTFTVKDKQRKKTRRLVQQWNGGQGKRCDEEMVVVVAVEVDQVEKRG